MDAIKARREEEPLERQDDYTVNLDEGSAQVGYPQARKGVVSLLWTFQAAYTQARPVRGWWEQQQQQQERLDVVYT